MLQKCLPFSGNGITLFFSKSGREHTDISSPQTLILLKGQTTHCSRRGCHPLCNLSTRPWRRASQEAAQTRASRSCPHNPGTLNHMHFHFLSLVFLTVGSFCLPSPTFSVSVSDREKKTNGERKRNRHMKSNSFNVIQAHTE